jgi:hypothetical protein
MIACLPAAHAQTLLWQQVTLHLGGQVQISLQRGALRFGQVVQAVAHQWIREQTVTFHRFVTLQTYSVGAFGHPVERCINFSQQPVAQLHALFRSLTGMSLPLHQIVTYVNRFFCESSLAGQYATLVCGLAGPNGEVEIHNAGHCPAIVVGRAGATCIEPTGLPLGMFLETEFAATAVQLETGDTIFLYTDGLSEASNETCEYGVERIMTFVHQQAARQPAELIAACLDDVRTFTNGVPSFDDMTVLALRRCG